MKKILTFTFLALLNVILFNNSIFAMGTGQGTNHRTIIRSNNNVQNLINERDNVNQDAVQNLINERGLIDEQDNVDQDNVQNLINERDADIGIFHTETTRRPSLFDLVKNIAGRTKNVVLKTAQGAKNVVLKIAQGVSHHKYKIILAAATIYALINTGNYVLDDLPGPIQDILRSDLMQILNQTELFKNIYLHVHTSITNAPELTRKIFESDITQIINSTTENSLINSVVEVPVDATNITDALVNSTNELVNDTSEGVFTTITNWLLSPSRFLGLGK